MKKLNVTLTLLLTMIAFTAFCGGKAKLVSGDLSAIKGKMISVKFDYSGMAVGKYKNESDYVSAKKADYNKDGSGRGDRWEGSWKADRAARFEPKFMELITKHAGSVVQFSNSGGDMTMLVKTTFTEPGFNVVMMRRPAIINTLYTFSDASGKELAKVSVTGATGSTFGGYDYDTGVRISEAYALSGKILGGFIAKALK